MSNNEIKYGVRFSGNLDKAIEALTSIREELQSEGFDLSEAPVRLNHTVEEGLPGRYMNRVTVFVRDPEQEA